LLVLPIDLLTGFVSDAGVAQPRLVGVAFDQRGALLVARRRRTMKFH
jgi:glucose/arabinose dehydrogenase